MDQKGMVDRIGAPLIKRCMEENHVPNVESMDPVRAEVRRR